MNGTTGSVTLPIINARHIRRAGGCKKKKICNLTKYGLTSDNWICKENSSS